MSPHRFRRWVSSRHRRPEEPVVDVEPDAVERAEPEPVPRAVVNERSARALLASGTPPLPPEAHKPVSRRRRQRRPVPAAPEPEPPAATTPREWNIWELQRAVRTSEDQGRQEEWSALFIHLREFANAEGNLPVEFDELVRESFAGVLEHQPEAARS
jgi:hypothetical protein